MAISTIALVTSSRSYARVEQFDSFLDQWFVFETLRRMFRDYRVSGSKVFGPGQLQAPILPGDFMQQRLNELAIRLCAQDVHHGLVASRETGLKVAPFESK